MSNDAHDAPRPDAGQPVASEGGAPEATGLDLQPDVERLHRAIRREPRDPIEGREPTPWMLWAIMGLTLFWSGWYLGRHGGEFGLTTHVAVAGRQGGFAQAVAGQAATAVADPIAAGRDAFGKNCQACHQQRGEGVPGVFPPIVGSEWVTGPTETVVRILLDGVHQPIVVAGATYNGAMPAWKDVLADDEIAAVATYIRTWAPNAASAVTPDVVARIRRETAGRATPWTAAELRASEPTPAGSTKGPARRGAKS